MGSSHSIDQFLKKLGDMSTATERQRTAALTEGALKTKGVMLAAAASKGVPPGGKIAGRRWGVSYGIAGTLHPEALVRFTGPFHLVNNPTRPHYIAAGGLGGSRAARSDAAFQASTTRFSGGSTRGAFGGRRKSRGKRALRTPYGPRAYVFHPGTSGKDILSLSKQLARQVVPSVMARSMSTAWKRAIG